MLVNDGYEISVITSCYDLNETEPLKNVILGEWNFDKNKKVFYTEVKEQTYQFIKHLIKQNLPKAVYLNGLYSLPFVIFPLIIWKSNFKSNIKLIWAPRGMLLEGALNIKPFKKRLFLWLVKFIGLNKGVVWHATDVQEALDIKKHFNKNAEVIIAQNIPKRPLENVVEIKKSANELRLVYLSLITEKKNLHLALQWINELGLPVIFDIYGPVKDNQYWETCKEIVNSTTKNISINYLGDVQSDKVQEVFTKYHALLLPTKGENFGHAIYECLSVGRPVIISTDTPWKDLKEKNAGFDISLKQPELFKEAIERLYNMNQLDYNKLIEGAHSIASSYWKENDFTLSYAKLFN